MPAPLLGLHHVTAICGDPQRNHEFYTRILGLRLVKQTVDDDDPTSWHLFYGNATGQPGTLLTFVARPDDAGGQVGVDQFGTVLLGIPTRSLGFWIERLIGHGIPYQQPARRFGERGIAFRDPDGLNLELVALGESPDATPWAGSSVPAEHAIKGIHGVTLWQGRTTTGEFFVNQLGFRRGGHESTTERLLLGQGKHQGVLDVVGATGLWNGSVGVGTIQQVAWSVANVDDLIAWLTDLRNRGIPASDVRDRTYYHAISLEAPGGAMVELATLGPGLTVDEDEANLGSTLQLPNRLERQRLGLEGMLPPLVTEPRSHPF